MLKQNIIFY